MCSQTGYIHCTPIKHKNQFDLMVRVRADHFQQLLGHTDLTFMADNEPTMRQLMRMTVNARLAMGLPTSSTTPPAYSHGNSLVENAIGRVRPLAGSFKHALGEKLGIEILTSSLIWTWAMRHAAWVINRFSVTAGHGTTGFELLSGKPYTGKICHFGEPVFGFQKSRSKGNPRWRRMVFLGKIDPQHTYLLYSGTHLIFGKVIWRFTSTSTVPHTSTGAALVEEWCPAAPELMDTSRSASQLQLSDAMGQWLRRGTITLWTTRQLEA